ncbi:hypothetical protein ACN47E_002327 [Coniothyrium glycines]
MPDKRTWSQANVGEPASEPPASRTRLAGSGPDDPTPSISRKVKACASCRKQKIKCIMNGSGPPCKRCTERNLSCVLNKSLQTLIEERSQWNETVIDDLSNIHAALQQALAKLSLPILPPLLTSGIEEEEQAPLHVETHHREEVPSCDNSPRLLPREEALLHAPIDSLYQITRLSALRSSDAHHVPTKRNDGHPLNDFISQGLVRLQDAERLFAIFLDRIDHFMYMVGSGGHRTLTDLRKSSSTLTACILAVAALHDPHSSHLYTVCSREFRRLMANSMFDRRMDQDSMRAMCIATYWLHDLSWMMSGYAIRRAMEMNLSSNYQKVLSSNNEIAMNNLRIWWVLYICDRHLSILYGRQSIVRDDISITGWEKLMNTSVFTESDKRLVSQMALLIIMGNVRELFGPDTGEPIPKAFAPKLMDFSLQIDHWMGFWSTELLRIHEFIGEFPTKGANLHHHLAKLHLHSHVFRGLKGGMVPAHFQSSASAAVASACAIVELVLSDHDIRESLVGIPHYIHSMIAFACVFLLKVAVRYSSQYVEDDKVFDLIAGAIKQFSATPVGNWHLVHMMAEGLEKMIAKQIQAKRSPTTMATSPARGSSNGSQPPVPARLGHAESVIAPAIASRTAYDQGLFESNFDDEYGFGTSSFLNFDTGTLDLDFTGFGF